MIRVTLLRCLLTLSALSILSPLGSSVSAQEQGVQAQVALPASALRKAKTVLVKEKFSIAGKEGALMPIFKLEVQVQRPGKVHLEMLPEESFYGKNAKTSFYVSDGVTQHEYNGLSNRFTNSQAPAAGERSNAQICFIAGIDLMLSPKGLPAPRTGTTRTVTNSTLDGKATVLIADSETPRKTPIGPVTAVTKTWLDGVTGLPIRRAIYTLRDEKATLNEQLDFTSWEFDKPIPSRRFVWTPPAGAEESGKLLAVGTPAPDFTAQTPDGKTVRLSDYKGKTVILDFWATWCGPCQRSMPHLQKVYEQVKTQEVVVLALCVWDTKAEYDKWLPLHTTKYTFPTLFDPAGRAEGNIAGGLYKVTGIPTQYVIDKEGKVAATSIGYEGEDDHRLETSLRKLGVKAPEPASTRK